ncbi:hypothetical protein QJS10_CPA10g00002 [Acorus calamus]|uniref:Uncharacterized protein n=1 Tax=Acorus calamus TaxID=4465 RepID=A0AAV9DY82_ACOCL|nr:hypothetical protein QJS10_CPA10g00002 [Acorus calamus]
MKTRSFRYEDYNNRRVFLRSYPLQWEGEEEEEDKGEVMMKVSKGDKKNKVVVGVKGRAMAVFHWSEGKVLLLRRLKHKVAYYLVACHPFGFKASANLLTV